MKNQKNTADNSADDPKERDEIEELEIFIKKKKTQNIALKKIMTKLDANDEQKVTK